MELIVARHVAIHAGFGLDLKSEGWISKSSHKQQRGSWRISREEGAAGGAVSADPGPVREEHGHLHHVCGCHLVTGEHIAEISKGLRNLRLGLLGYLPSSVTPT